MTNVRISVLIKRAALVFDKISNQLLTPYDLTGSQFKILMVLYKSPMGFVRQTDIEARFDMTNPTVTGLVQKLEAKGLVFRSIMEAARKSSIVVISGNYKEPVSFDLTQLQRREITLLGHMMYIRQEFDDALEQLSLGNIHTEGLITQEWTLEQYPDAFRYIDDHPNEVVKMVVRISDDETV